MGENVHRNAAEGLMAGDDSATRGKQSLATTIRMVLTMLLQGTVCWLMCGGWLVADQWFVDNVETDRDPSFETAHWRLLPTPPEPLARLKAADIGVVYGETHTGAILSCSRNSRFDTDCWNVVSSVPVMPGSACFQPINYEPPALEVEAVDQVYTEDCNPGIGGNVVGVSIYKYVLTAQGEVWQWGVDENHWAETPHLDRLRSGFVVGVALVFGLIPPGLIALIWAEPALRKVIGIVRKRQECRC